MIETGAVSHFWDFLKMYFAKDAIVRHPEYEIIVEGRKKKVRPDFLIDADIKLLFEFKELKDSQVRNSHRHIRIKRFDEPPDPYNNSRAVPGYVDRYVTSAIREAIDQLSPAREIGCPAVLVIYSRYRGIRVMLEQHIEFTAAMYRRPDIFAMKKTPMNKYPYISALAYFSVNTDESGVTLYRIRFYHNIFAERNMAVKPLDDRKCQHYVVDKDLNWRPLLDHEEELGA